MLAVPEWISFTTEAAQRKPGPVPSVAFGCDGFAGLSWRRGNIR